jgi:hypothetical protein
METVVNARVEGMGAGGIEQREGHQRIVQNLHRNIRTASLAEDETVVRVTYPSTLSTVAATPRTSCTRSWARIIIKTMRSKAKQRTNSSFSATMQKNSKPKQMKYPAFDDESKGIARNARRKVVSTGSERYHHQTRTSMVTMPDSKEEHRANRRQVLIVQEAQSLVDVSAWRQVI